MRPARLLPAAALLVAFVLVLPGPSIAADPPCLTARMVVPWGSGGGTDLLFRALADAANRAGAKPRLVVVNLSGEDGVRGSQEALKARPDGCTLLAVNQSLMTSFIAGQASFNWTDFAPVARLTRTPSVIGARPDAGFDSLPQMLAAARAPAGVSAGSSQGLASHFLFLLIQDRTGASFRPMFFDGTRERLTALLAGKVDVVELNIASARRLAAESVVKALAVTGAARSPALPDVPTLKEQGVDLVFTIDRGLVLPKQAAPELVDRYAALFDKALRDPQVAALLDEHGTAAAFLAPKAYAGYWQDSFAEWRRLAKAAGIYRQPD